MEHFFVTESRRLSIGLPVVMLVFSVALAFIFAACASPTTPADPTPDDIDFGVGATITRTINVGSGDGASLRTTLEGLSAGNYIVNVTGEVTISNVIYLNRPSATISLRGAGSGAKLIQDANDPVFGIGNGVKLILRDITLQGKNERYAVSIYSGAELVMESDSVICNISDNGLTGVDYSNGGTFRMKGGEISGFSTNGNGGVRVYGANAVFEKTGGTIYGSSTPDPKTVVVADQYYNPVLYRADNVTDNISVTLNAGGTAVASSTGTWTTP